MNPLVKNAAVKKYGAIWLDGKTDAEALRVLIESEKKKNSEDLKYTPDEVTEILSMAIVYTGDGPAKPGTDKAGSGAQGPGTAKAEPKVNGDQPDAAATLNKNYEEYEVEPKYIYHENPFNKNEKRKELTGFEKVRKLRTTAITPTRAETLNSQSEQSLRRLYEV